MASTPAELKLHFTTELVPSNAMHILSYLLRGHSHHELTRLLSLGSHESAHAMRLCAAIDGKRFEDKLAAVVLQLHSAHDSSFELTLRFDPLVPNSCTSLASSHKYGAQGDEDNDDVHVALAAITPAAKRQRESKSSASTGGSSGGATTDSRDAAEETQQST